MGSTKDQGLQIYTTDVTIQVYTTNVARQTRPTTDDPQHLQTSLLTDEAMKPVHRGSQLYTEQTLRITDWA